MMTIHVPGSRSGTRILYQPSSPPIQMLTCGRPARETFTTFPPFHEQEYSAEPNKRDSAFELGFEDGFDTSDMASATSPYIKPEPNDYGFDPNQFMQYNQAHGQSNNMNINPASLSNGNAMSQGYMGSSFNMGNSGIADDELLDLQLDQSNHQQNGNFDFNQGMQNYLNQQQMHQQSSSGMFSHTPDGAPMQSPFTQDFNYGQLRSMQGRHFAGGHSMPAQSAFRPHMQHIDRKISDSQSPATPTTPVVNSLGMGDNFSHPGMKPIHQRQSSSMGNGWDSTPSGHSWEGSSPFPSPSGAHPMHPQISEVLKNTTGHHSHQVASSLPTKMEPGTSGPPFSTQEAKRKRRRESHNMVERRRRDNINERIHDLGTLVPQHRLEDDKVRKHLQNNAPLSPSITNATGMSPPNPAASILSGSQGRRPTGPGSITQGLPTEEKDKGPNKGDILNGSVAWTRDIMWYMQLKLQQEQELQELVQQLGGVWPFQPDEEEKRMSSEIMEVLSKHAPAGGFTGYSRGPGSGLRVPGFTNVAGDSISNDGQGTSSGGHSVPSVSPGFQPSGSGMTGNGVSANQFWGGEFKEEDEYGMDMQ